MQDWNLLLDKLMIGFKNNLWQNVFSFFPFLFFFFPLFYFFSFRKKKNKKKKQTWKYYTGIGILPGHWWQ